VKKNGPKEYVLIIRFSGENKLSTRQDLQYSTAGVAAVAVVIAGRVQGVISDPYFLDSTICREEIKEENLCKVTERCGQLTRPNLYSPLNGVTDGKL